jgi:hypothetical protein
MWFRHTYLWWPPTFNICSKVVKVSYRPLLFVHAIIEIHHEPYKIHTLDRFEIGSIWNDVWKLDEGCKLPQARTLLLIWKDLGVDLNSLTEAFRGIHIGEVATHFFRVKSTMAVDLGKGVEKLPLQIWRPAGDSAVGQNSSMLIPNVFRTSLSSGILNALGGSV